MSVDAFFGLLEKKASASPDQGSCCDSRLSNNMGFCNEEDSSFEKKAGEEEADFEPVLSKGIERSLVTGVTLMGVGDGKSG